MDVCQVVSTVCAAEGLPLPVAEYRFHPVRRWRFDLAWPEQRIAVEVEGGAWIYGRHNHPRGFINDMEKYNAAVIMGWRVLRYTPEQIRAGQWLDDLRELMYHEKHERETDERVQLR